jgi:hypothetical protein
VFGAVIARGQDYRQVFQYFRPGFDLDAARHARLDAGLGEYLNGNDLYPDVRPCLQTLKDAGYFVGIAGNQTTRAGHFLRALNLPCDVLATSDDWGVTKPAEKPIIRNHMPHPTRPDHELGPLNPRLARGHLDFFPGSPRPHLTTFSDKRHPAREGCDAVCQHLTA